MSQEEIFKFVGQIRSFMFFNHEMAASNISDEELKAMCVGVYDCMIHSMKIKAAETIIIFNNMKSVIPGKEVQEVQPVAVSHATHGATFIPEDRLAAARESIGKAVRPKGTMLLTVKVIMNERVPSSYWLDEGRSTVSEPLVLPPGTLLPTLYTATTLPIYETD